MIRPLGVVLVSVILVSNSACYTHFLFHFDNLTLPYLSPTSIRTSFSIAVGADLLFFFFLFSFLIYLVSCVYFVAYWQRGTN